MRFQMSSQTLKEFLDSSDITDQELAELIPCSRSYITRIANGSASPGYKMAARIQEVTHGMVSKAIWFPEKEEIK